MPIRFSVIMPAFRAENTIAASLGSLLAQSHRDWDLHIISDDGKSYEHLLTQAGITDTRFQYLSTGNIGTGSSNARNVGLNNAQGDFVAILDADDLMRPDKLEIMAQHLTRHSLVSTALDIRNSEGILLRQVSAGDDMILSAGTYKFTCFSMDSMIAYDRRQGDPRYDADLPCLTDLDFLLKLFATREQCFHIGAPLHTYVKQAVSITNGPGTSRKIADTKKKLLNRLNKGHYPMLSSDGDEGMSRFLKVSLKAEQTYETALKDQPDLLFEDHLEPLLATNSSSG